MLGEVIHGYRVDRALSVDKGGFGDVFFATHVDSGAEAVVKVLKPEMSAHRDIVTRFFNEARAAASIHHPGIVQIHNVGYHGDRAYLLMERLRGDDLETRLAAGPLPLDRAIVFMRQAAGAIGAVHQRGIVHRDLKPANLFVVADPDVVGGERVKVLDFGIAKLSLDAGGSKTQGIFGTPAYMSPEQCASSGDVDVRSDLYALGCIFYELVCGRPPFGHGGIELVAAHLRDPIPPPRTVATSVPPAVEAIILQLLEKQPQLRLQSCAALITALDDLAVSVPLGATPPSPPPRSRPAHAAPATPSMHGAVDGAIAVAAPTAGTARHRGLLVGLGVAVVVGIAIAAVLVVRGGDGRTGVATGAPAPALADAARVDAVVACEALQPAPANPVLGVLPRTAASLVGPDLHGGTIDVEALAGKVVLVTFQASWNGPTRAERPTFGPLADAVGGGLAIVQVVSEDSVDTALRDAEAGARYQTMFDHGRDCSAVGAITASWGVERLPESFLVDRAGNVRFYFINVRDWSSPEAIACVRALLDDVMVPISVPPMGAGPPKHCPSSAPPAIRGTLSFSARTRGQVKAGTAIFVVAKRADAQGEPSGMPLAIERLTYVSGPLPFAFDEADRMVAGSELAGEIVLTARYDQDGEGMTRQPGDIVGQVRVTAPASDVKLVLDTVVP